MLRRLWRPPDHGPYRRLADEAGRWAEELPLRWEQRGRPFERSLLDAVLAAIGELAPSQPELVVAHQDLHGGNVLRSGDAWVAIDAKPLLAERAFDTASLVRDRRPWLAREPIRSGGWRAGSTWSRTPSRSTVSACARGGWCTPSPGTATS